MLTNLSLIIPIYNVEKYLKRCINSIVDQMDENLEVILVDDGSPDKCPQICDEYASVYKNIKVVHKKNGGLADAVKVGTLNASGKYIAYIDSDDWFEPGWYDTVKEILNQFPNIDMIMYAFQRVVNDVKQSSNSYSILEEGYYDEKSINEIKKTYMIPGGIGPTRWDKVYSRDIALKCIEYYDTGISIGEDMVFSSIATDLMKNTYVTKKCFVNYYINDGSMTQHFNEKYLSSFECLFKSLEKYFEDKPILYYINYINMRTMVNAVGKSDYTNKVDFLSNVFSMKNIHERIDAVSIENLNLQNRLFRKLMLLNKTRALLVIAAIYRKLK